MRRQHLVSACLSLAGFALMGCAHTSTPARTLLADEGGRRDPVCPEAVTFYDGTGAIGAAFRPVAVLNYTEEARMVNETLTMNAVRRKAANMGATAVILPSYTVGEEQARFFAAVLGSGTERVNQSIAIYVPEDSARVRVTCDSNGEGN